MDGNAFVMYRSYFNTYEILKKKRPEDAHAFLDAIITFGFTGKMPDEDDDIWVYNLDTIFAQIAASSSRHAKAMGNNGGRPSSQITAEQIYELMAIHKTWKAIAAELGIDEDTLRKLRNQLGITEKTPAQYRKTEKPTQSESRKTEKPTEKPSDRKAAEPKNLNNNNNNNININNNNFMATPENSVDSNEDMTNQTDEPKNTEENSVSRKMMLVEICDYIENGDGAIKYQDGALINIKTGEVEVVLDESSRDAYDKYCEFWGI